MAFLDLRLMPASEEASDCSAPARASPAPEVSSDQLAVPATGFRRRRAAHADVLPRAGKDSFHWLKYGEKLLRDRKTLRHYYRCASRVESGCNAKKMVDVLVTTGECNWHYREDHNHPAPAGAVSQPSRVQEPQSSSGQAHPINFDLLSQGAVQSLIPFLTANQSAASGNTSAAALAAMLLAANRGDAASQLHGSPLLNDHQLPTSIQEIPGLQVATPVAAAATQTESNSRHLQTCPPALPASSPAQSLPPSLIKQYQQYQQQQLEALLSSDSPQVSLGSHGVPGLPSAATLDGSLTDCERKLPATQSQLFPLHRSGSPSSSRSDVNRREGRRLKKDSGASRLSKLGTGLATLSPVLSTRKRKATGDSDSADRSMKGPRALVPTLEEASADHAEAEQSQGSSCVKPEAGRSKGEYSALSGIQCCSHGSCTWLTLGHGSQHCGCYSGLMGASGIDWSLS